MSAFVTLSLEKASLRQPVALKQYIILLKQRAVGGTEPLRMTPGVHVCRCHLPACDPLLKDASGAAHCRADNGFGQEASDSLDNEQPAK